MSGWWVAKAGGVAILPGVTDDARVLQELSSFMDPNLGEVAATPEPDTVALDEATLALAQQVARPPWYASWIGALVILVLPVLLTVAGGLGGGRDSVASGGRGIPFPLVFCLPPLAP